MQEINKAFSIKDGKIRISKKQLKIRAAAVLIIIALSFLIGEALVRIFDPQILYDRHNPAHPTYPKEVEYDQDLGWSTVKDYKVQPHTYQGRNPIITITHNSEGYRMDHEVDANKNIVVMTGDSLTYGFWVDDKKVVSSQLNKMLGGRWEVINLGAGGYGTDQAFLRFIRDGQQYKPKVVVHTLFNNDFSNIISRYQYNVFKPIFSVNKGGNLELGNVPVPLSDKYELSYPKVKTHPFKGFERFMRSWSHLYVAYKGKIAQIKSAIKSSFKPQEKRDYFADYKDGEFWAIEKDYTREMNYAVILNSLILKEYSSMAMRDNITFIFVVIGDRISVDPEMQKATLEKYSNIDGSFFDYDKPYRLLEEFSERENIKIVNLLPVFREQFQKGNDVYLEGDNHLNDYGHEIFAQQVYDAMVEMGVEINGK